jgi:hypothetical protein
MVDAQGGESLQCPFDPVDSSLLRTVMLVRSLCTRDARSIYLQPDLMDAVRYLHEFVYVVVFAGVRIALI